MDLVEVSNYLGFRHPWELSRRDLALKMITDLGLDPKAKVVDVGAGDCFVARSIKETGLDNITVVDSSFSASNAPADLQTCKNLSDVPDKTADLVIALDVIEHVEDDREFAKGLVAKLKPNGQLVATVPAWQFLFGGHDVFLKHFRRYRTRQLADIFEAEGMTIQRSHYFFFSLFLVRCLQKLSAKMMNIVDSEDIGVSGWRFSENHWITKLTQAALDVDFKVCSMLAAVGIPLPGLSLVVVCKREQ